MFGSRRFGRPRKPARGLAAAAGALPHLPALFLALGLGAGHLWGQEVRAGKPGAGASGEWVREIGTDLDFDLCDRRAAVAAARAVQADPAAGRDLRTHALQILVWDAVYGGRPADKHLAELLLLAPDDPSVAVRALQATLVSSTGDERPAAVRRLTEYVDEHPDEPFAVRMLAEWLVFQKRPADAEVVVNKALAKRPDDGVLLSAKAAVLYARNQPAGALRASEAALRAPPHIRQVDFLYLTHAKILCALNRPADALAFTALAARLKSEHIDATAHQYLVNNVASQGYHLLGKHEAACVLARGLPAADPGTPEPLRVLAARCVAAGRYVEAQQTLHALARLTPRDAAAYALEAQVHWGSKDEVGALAIIRAGLTAFPDDAELTALLVALLVHAAADAIRDPKTANEIARAAVARRTGPGPRLLLAAAAAHGAVGEHEAAAAAAVKRAEPVAVFAPADLRQAIAAAKAACDRRETAPYPLPPAVPEVGLSTGPPVKLVAEITDDCDYAFVAPSALRPICLHILRDGTETAAAKTHALDVATALYRRAGDTVQTGRGDTILAGTYPDHPRYRRNQLLSETAGRPAAERAAAWNAFCKIFPYDIDGLGEWAVALSAAGEAETAEAAADRLLGRRPDHPAGLHAKAIVLSRRNRTGESQDVIGRWLTQADTIARHAAAYLLRAENSIAGSRPDEALANLAVVKRLDPSLWAAASTREMTGRAFKAAKKTTLAGYYFARP